MSLSPRLVVLLSISAITFVLFLFVAIIQPSANDEQEQIEHGKKSQDNGDSGTTKKRLTQKPVPKLSSPNQQQQSDGDNNNNPVTEFFNSALKSHPLSNCPTNPEKIYGENDLVQHNTAEDLWIVVYGYVLNVTSFVHHHPGGVTMIMKGATTATTNGDIKVTDVAELFTVYHQPGTVSLFDTFCIGRFKSASA